ncbi:hypothetical protein GCM10014719_05420 [Planomonospora parontospora subsp. antibiotica]|nr:hypothetical protein GCM10014719_05420 [Planomonospora parontospora subsp. antibiotica]
MPSCSAAVTAGVAVSKARTSTVVKPSPSYGAARTEARTRARCRTGCGPGAVRAQARAEVRAQARAEVRAQARAQARAQVLRRKAVALRRQVPGSAGFTRVA